MVIFVYKFPRDFVIGYSCSGFQFEAGLPGGEDPNSDWWVWVHDEENIAAGIVSGDLPENGPGYWHLYKQDHDIAEKLGFNTIRVGIEWSRIFPKPTFDVKVDVEEDRDGNIISVDVPEKALEELDRLANKNAVEHYREMFSDWVSRGKKLIINLNHFTLPIWLHNPIKVRKLSPDRAPAGWLDKRAVVEFAKYAAYIAWKLGDLPVMWSTMNEPNVVYEQGYMFTKGGFPPGYLSFEAAAKARKHLLEAHARAYDNIKKYSKKPVGIIYTFAWSEVLGEEPSGGRAKRIREQYVYSFIDELVFGPREDLKKRVDWLGVNYYSRLVYGVVGEKVVPLHGYGFLCGEGRVSSRAGRPCSDMGWEVYPEGLYYLLSELWKRYQLDMIVTESGIADRTDRYRSYHLVSHLYSIYKALQEGISVKGYLHWSLTDNYEWARGFSMRFGLVHVDFKTKKRYLRPSALVYREIAMSSGIPEELEHLKEVDQLVSQ